MVLSLLLMIISLNALIECKGSSRFCTHEEWNNFNVNRIQSIFTFNGKVYLTFGSNVTKFWVYDIHSQEIQKDFITISQMFPNDWSIV